MEDSGVKIRVDWETENALHHKLMLQRAELAAIERAEAYAAVSRALSTYRWWGWTNIINTIRLAVQAWRIRRRDAKSN